MLRRILSIDTETYGAAHGLPPQTCFTPRRSLLVDGVPPAHLLLCASITTGTLPCDTTSPSPLTSPTTNFPGTSGPPDNGTGSTSTSAMPEASTHKTVSTLNSSVSIASTLAAMTPGPTMVLPLALIPLPASHKDEPLPDLSDHDRSVLLKSAALDLRTSLLILYRWITWADTLVGMNLGFDIPFLRHHHPLLRRALSGSHLILDLSWFNYLDSETRPEKSLKSLGPVLGTHTYSQTLKGGHSFQSLTGLLHYAAQDPHNTLLSLAAVSSRIAHRHTTHPTSKLSPFCLSHFSDTLWCCIEMSEAGLPIHRPSLEALAHRCIRRIRRCELLCSRRHSLTLSGEGSQSSKSSFMSLLIDAVQSHHFVPLPSGGGCLKVSGSIPELPPYSDHIRDHPLLQFTEVKKDLSFSESNRTLLCSLLPPSHPLQRPNRLLNYHTHASKLLGTYCYPYLWNQKAKKSGRPDRTSTLCPQVGQSSDPRTLQPPEPPLCPPSANVPTVESSSPSASPSTTASPKPKKSPKPRKTGSPRKPHTSQAGSATAAAGTTPPSTAPTAAPSAPPPPPIQPLSFEEIQRAFPIS